MSLSKTRGLPLLALALTLSGQTALAADSFEQICGEVIRKARAARQAPRDGSDSRPQLNEYEKQKWAYCVAAQTAKATEEKRQDTTMAWGAVTAACGATCFTPNLPPVACYVPMGAATILEMMTAQGTQGMAQSMMPMLQMAMPMVSGGGGGGNKSACGMMMMALGKIATNMMQGPAENQAYQENLAKAASLLPGSESAGQVRADVFAGTSGGLFNTPGGQMFNGGSDTSGTADGNCGSGSTDPGTIISCASQYDPEFKQFADANPGFQTQFQKGTGASLTDLFKGGPLKAAQYAALGTANASKDIQTGMQTAVAKGMDSIGRPRGSLYAEGGASDQYRGGRGAKPPGGGEEPDPMSAMLAEMMSKLGGKPGTDANKAAEDAVAKSAKFNGPSGIPEDRSLSLFMRVKAQYYKRAKQGWEGPITARAHIAPVITPESGRLPATPTTNRK